MSIFFGQNELEERRLCTLSGLTFAWTKFRESAPFLPNSSHFPRSFSKNHDFKYFAWTKFREIGQNTRKSRNLIHAKINPLKVMWLKDSAPMIYHWIISPSTLWKFYFFLMYQCKVQVLMNYYGKILYKTLFKFNCNFNASELSLKR